MSEETWTVVGWLGLLGGLVLLMLLGRRLTRWVETRELDRCVEERFCAADLAALMDRFDEQFPDIPTGGFLNPRLMSTHRGQLEFFCHYDGYDNEEDGWTWYYDWATRQFYN